MQNQTLTITKEEIAETLNVSIMTIRRLEKNKKNGFPSRLPFLNTLIFDRAEFEAWYQGVRGGGSWKR